MPGEKPPKKSGQRVDYDKSGEADQHDDALPMIREEGNKSSYPKEDPSVFESKSPTVEPVAPELADTADDVEGENWGRDERSYQEEIKSKEKDIQELSSDYHTLIADHNKLTQQHELLSRKLDRIDRDNRGLIKENDTLVSVTGEAKTAVEKFQKRSSELAAEVKALEKAAGKQDKELKDLQTKLIASEAQQKRFRDKSEEDSRAFAQSKQAIDDLLTREALKEEMVRVKDVEILALRQRNQTLEADMRQEMTQHKRLRESIASGASLPSPKQIRKLARFSLTSVPEHVATPTSTKFGPSARNSVISQDFGKGERFEKARQSWQDIWSAEQAMTDEDSSERSSVSSSVGGGRPGSSSSFTRFVISKFQGMSLAGSSASDAAAQAESPAVLVPDQADGTSLFNGGFSLEAARRSSIEAHFDRHMTTETEGSVRSSQASPGYIPAYKTPLQPYQERAVVVPFSQMRVTTSSISPPEELNAAIEVVTRAFPGLQLRMSRDLLNASSSDGRPRSTSAPVYSHSIEANRGISQVLIDHLPDDMLASPLSVLGSTLQIHGHSTQTENGLPAAPNFGLSDIVSMDIVPSSSDPVQESPNAVDDTNNAVEEGLGWSELLGYARRSNLGPLDLTSSEESSDSKPSPDKESDRHNARMDSEDGEEEKEESSSPEGDQPPSGFVLMYGPSVQTTPEDDTGVSIPLETATMLLYIPAPPETVIEEDDQFDETSPGNHSKNSKPDSPNMILTTPEQTQQRLAFRTAPIYPSNTAGPDSPPPSSSTSEDFVINLDNPRLTNLGFGWLWMALLYFPLLLCLICVYHESGGPGAIPWTEHGAFGYPGYPYDTTGTRVYASARIWWQAQFRNLRLLDRA